MSDPYDSAIETWKHIDTVFKHARRFERLFRQQVSQHDMSKLEEPEKSAFDIATPKLRGLTYGSPEYKAATAELGDALKHHYAHNRHHPEFGDAGMEWRPVPGYEGHYEVSSHGDVRSVERIAARSGAQGDVTKRGQPRKAHVTAKGYLRMQLVRNGERRNYLVHRLVAEAFIREPEDGEQINHRNGNKRDNRVPNLEWATASENLQHAYDASLREGSVKYVVRCAALDITTFGCDAMARKLREAGHGDASASGVWGALDRNGTHVGLTFTSMAVEEHRRSQLRDMDLIDIVEMLCDWKAASERHADGDIRESLQINAKRYGISDDLATVLGNTIDRLWPEDER